MESSLEQFHKERFWFKYVFNFVHHDYCKYPTFVRTQVEIISEPNYLAYILLER